MDNTWVKSYRKSIENGWLKNKNVWLFWSYCLLKASNKKYKTIVGYQEIILEPGQFIFGRKKASKEIDLSEREIRTCLDFLKNSQNLTIKSTNKFSIVTICNWETYQGNGFVERPAKRPASDQQATTNNNVKNVKNNNIKDITSQLPSEVYDIYDFFISTFTEKERQRYEPKTETIKQDWLDTIDKCHRIDKYPYWKIIDIIDHYRNEDPFWSKTFYSAKKLRQKSNNDIKWIDEWCFKLENTVGLHPPKNEREYICQLVDKKPSEKNY